LCGHLPEVLLARVMIYSALKKWELMAIVAGAAATAVASTDRSKSRWKNKTSEQQGKGSAPSRTFNRRSTNLMN
jgi:hypothetical protein